MLLYVVCWEYHDKSNWGLLKAYTDKKKADDLVLIMAPHTDKQLFTIEVPCEQTEP
jgi:hypothetical protein